MSLTMGTGPFGHAPAGSFNFETPDKGAILLDVIPRRVRGLKHGELVNIAWTYADPAWEVGPIRDRIAFYDEFVDIEIDGEPQERPVIPFSRR